MNQPSGLTRHRREFAKFWLRFRVPLTAVVVLTFVLGGGNYLWENYEASNLASHEAEVNATIGGYVRALGNPVAAEQRAFEALVEKSSLAGVLRSGDPAAQAAREAELRSALPGSIGVRLLAPGLRKVSYERKPPISYATLDMVRDSLRSNRPMPAEVHLVGRPEQHVALLRRVEDAAGVAGHVLAALPVELLTRSVSAVPLQRGYVELIQRVAGGTAALLARTGDVGLKSGVGRTIPVAGTRWNLVFWTPPATSTELSALRALVPVAIGVGVLLLVGLLIAGLAIRSRRRAAERVMLGGAVATEEVEEQAPEGALAAVRMGNVPGPDAESVGITVVEELEMPDLAELDLADVPQFDADDATAQGAGPPPPPPAGGDALDLAPGAGTLSPAIFRAYDVRGIVGEGLDADVVRLIGRAIGTEAWDRGQQTIVVARDGRVSGEELRDALVEGLLSSGRDVVDIGMVPTPVLYFATYFLDTGSGVMVTGSHNPADYNGLKIMLGGETLFGDAIQRLRIRAESGEFTQGSGELQQMDLLADYIRRVSEDVPVALGSAYRIVLDCGNGIAGDVAPKLIQALGHDVVELYCDVDGTFPNHPADPTQPENLADLCAAVRAEGADIGFAFDGDGDRLGVVDGEGNIIWADRVMMLFAKDILERHPGASIVFDVKCSTRLRDVILEHGGVPIMDRTGHSYMKNKLLTSGAQLAGELSGHIFFKDRWYGFDDGMYAAARLLEILMASRRVPAEVFAELPTGITTPELRLDLAEGEPFAIMESVLADPGIADAEIITIDGLRAEFSDGWGLMRASNTTPGLIFRFEADDDAAMARIQGTFRARLESVDPGLVAPF